ncbi:MAG: tripartite tricarboxylate transporter TctB family protein [bacterium]|nr:MAG: tripartite tricarboxylate transporter TctB family protein [bacterium]
MKRGELITAAIFIVIAVITLIDSVKMGIGWDPQAGPKPGFVPFYLAMLLLVSSVFILVTRARRHDDRAFFVSKEGMHEAVRIFGCATLLAAGIVWMGVYIPTFVFCVVFSRWLGKHRWVTVAVFSVITTLAVFYGMEKALKIPLPKSPLYHKGLFIF